MKRPLRFLILTAGMASVAFGNQSLVLTPGRAGSFSIPSVSAFTSLGSTRLEARFTNLTIPTSAAIVFSLPGMYIQFRSSGELCAVNSMDSLPNDGPWMCALITGLSDVTIRIQRDLPSQVFRLEVWSNPSQSSVTPYCGTVQVTGNGNHFPCPISGVNLQSWAGTGNLGGTTVRIAQLQIAWIKWFSTVIPPGSSPSSENTPADLADWRFEGNTNSQGTDGYNLSIGGGFTYTSSPIYPPVCNAGTSQTFRAGFSGQLDGTGSQPLDGGTVLTYLWQQQSGPSASFSAPMQASARPLLGGLVFGTYVFQLTVTDGSGQSSSCTIKDGAVASDDNGVVITGNPAVDTLLGPLIRYGANPWPWYDNRHQVEATIQIANMDPYYSDFWDVSGPGTITVNANNATVSGTGTSFTTTFCQGPTNALTPKSSASIIVWYPTNNPSVPGETGRRLMYVASCQSDNQLTLTNPWYSDTLPGSGLNYTEQDSSNLTAWSYNAAPANYYDNVAAFYSLYYRSGDDDYLNAARKLADRFWTSPEVDRGTSYTFNGSGNTWPARSSSILGLVLRALDGRPDMWPGMRKIWSLYETYLSVYDISFGPGIWDTREEAYHLATVSYCALFDPDPGTSAACQSSISKSFANVWTPFRLSDGSWGMLYDIAGWTGSVALVNGSTSVIGIGTNWTSGILYPGQIIWFTNGTSPPPLSVQNSTGDPVVYTPTFVDATHLTLDRPYAGSTGIHGWAAGNGGGVGWGAQPYMMGLMTTAFDFAAKAIANSDPANSALAHSYNQQGANWIKTYGYWPLQKGLYYFANTANCQAPISDTNTNCTAGNNASQSRTLSAEAIRGIGTAYMYGKDVILKNFGDTLFSAMFSKPGTGGPNPDGSYVSDLDDGSGSYLLGTPPLGQAPKWFGVFFGFGDGSSWPGYSIGGSATRTTRPVRVGFNMTGVPGAQTARVSAVQPDGELVQAVCALSPCTLGVDSREGQNLIGLEYLSVSGTVLAATTVPIVQ